jgi:hypothetical protein
MTRKNAWSPTEGPGPAPQQQVPARTAVHGDGHDDRDEGLWAPSEGPVRTEPGGPGGETDGQAHVYPPYEDQF